MWTAARDWRFECKATTDHQRALPYCSSVSNLIELVRGWRFDICCTETSNHKITHKAVEWRVFYSLCLKLVGCDDIGHRYHFILVHRMEILRNILQKTKSTMKNKCQLIPNSNSCIMNIMGQKKEREDLEHKPAYHWTMVT